MPRGEESDDWPHFAGLLRHGSGFIQIGRSGWRSSFVDPRQRIGMPIDLRLGILPPRRALMGFAADFPVDILDDPTALLRIQILEWTFRHSCWLRQIHPRQQTRLDPARPDVLVPFRALLPTVEWRPSDQSCARPPKCFSNMRLAHSTRKASKGIALAKASELARPRYGHGSVSPDRLPQWRSKGWIVDRSDVRSRTAKMILRKAL